MKNRPLKNSMSAAMVMPIDQHERADSVDNRSDCGDDDHDARTERGQVVELPDCLGGDSDGHEQQHRHIAECGENRGSVIAK
jgi:hypothetical protein